MKEYSLKFTQLSKHAHMVADSRSKMNNLHVISDLVVNECMLSMFIPNMDTSRLMVHAKKIEQQIGRELKKTRAEDGNFSKAIYEVQEKQRFKKRFSNQGPLNTPRVNKSKVCAPKPQERKSSGSYVKNPLSVKCDRKHDDKCLVSMGNCYRCGKKSTMKRDCL